MKKVIVIFSLLFICCSFSMAQQTATVILARKGLYTGYAGPVKIFMDGKIMCELKNNAFSTHTIPIGTHSFHAQWYGKGSSEKAKEKQTELELKPDQEYYFQLVKQDEGFWSYIHVQEVTASTWKNLKVKLKEDDCH